MKTVQAMTELDPLAVTLHGAHLIEASAGTGKTWNICTLYLRLLLERQLEVPKILVVSFTNAATAELRSRIRGRLYEALALVRNDCSAPEPQLAELIAIAQRNAGLDDKETADRLQAALAAFDEAAIYTIHGFCQRALAEMPFAAGLPYELQLMEDDSELRFQAVADFWRRRVAGGDLPPLLAAYLGARGDTPERWAKLLARLQAKPLSRVLWPQGLDAVPTPDADAIEAAFRTARDLWTAQGADATQLLLDNLDQLDGRTYKEPKLRAAADAAGRWFAGGDALGLRTAPEDVVGLLGADKLAEKTLKKKRTPTHPVFNAVSQLLTLRGECLEQLELLRLWLLRDMSSDAGVNLRDAKRSRRVLAFDDILFNTYAALRGEGGSALAAALRQLYPVALIDEFQDTDPLQFAVFNALYGSGGGNHPAGDVFLVGDPKQAIYSFRNADLHTYLRARAGVSHVHTLSSNQRSAAALIEGVNCLFANPAAFILPGLEFLPARAGAKPRKRFIDETEPESAALRIWQLPRDAAGNHLMRPEARLRAVSAIAAEIARLLRGGAQGRIRIDDHGLRPQDIAVLVKSHAQAALVKLALSELGIGSVELSRDSVLDSIDAEELERVLLAVAAPVQRPTLLAACATGLMGGDAAAVLALSMDDAEMMLMSSRFAAYRDTWLQRGFGYALRQWMNGEEIAPRLLGRGDGERRLTNLLHLAELLQQASVEHASPEALLRWYAARRDGAGENESAQLRLESDRNLVHIVTIHKSKGLEYEFVFCPLLWDHVSSSRGSVEACEYHDDQGNAVMDFRPEAAKDKDIQRQRREEAAAEYMRLIYVAVTRAAQRCYLVAGCYLNATSGDRTSVKQSARNLLNWLAAGAGMSYDEWVTHEPDVAAIEMAWQHIADSAPAAISLEVLPSGRGEALEDATPDGAGLAPLPPPPHIPAGWRIGSYSALQQGAEQESAAADHDARVVTPVPGEEDAALPEDDILRFPRGAAAGECLHAVFERCDFGKPETWDAAIARALEAHVSGDSPLRRRMLRNMLKDVLATPLNDGVVLNTVAVTARLTELGFHLPAHGLSAPGLNAWLREHGYPMPRLAFGALEGYLKGYIDLVFAHGRRYYVLDWKSNHLGQHMVDYGQPALAQAMQDHGYHLQYLIYSLALHRYLSRRIPHYDYGTHFGGVFYLFVRGVRPGWKDADGKPTGVWFHRPDAAAVNSFDRLLAGEAVTPS